jgi:membrane protein DedA with SNARE-associated domain
LDLPQLADALADLIRSSVESDPHRAHLVIALAMLLENVCPPIPSELVMPLAGCLVHEGRLALVPVILAGLCGTVAGAWFWYGVGRMIQEERLERWLARHGRWLGIQPAALAASRRWFRHHGPAVVFWGRMLPGLRPFVSVPAGIERMPQPTFLLWTGAGSLVWVGGLTLAGRALGASWTRVLAWSQVVVGLMEEALLVALAAGGVWLLVRRLRNGGAGGVTRPPAARSRPVRRHAAGRLRDRHTAAPLRSARGHPPPCARGDRREEEEHAARQGDAHQEQG